MTLHSRRSLLGFIAVAPAIVRVGSLMPVKSFKTWDLGGEEYMVVQASFDGVNYETLMKQKISSAYDIPVKYLFGQKQLPLISFTSGRGYEVGDIVRVTR